MSRVVQQCFYGLVCGLLCVVPSVVAAETVTRFDATYDVQADGTVGVTETIEYDFADAKRHGIYRTLERTHAQPATAWYKQRTFAIELSSVTRNGTEAPFRVTEDGVDWSVRVGDPDRTITGTHTYELTYRLRGALSYGDAGTEFYWDVTGNQWDVPIEQVRATVTAAAPAQLADQAACYQGGSGANDECDELTTSTSSVAFYAPGLGSREALTIAAALDPTTIATLRVEEVRWLPLWVAVLVLWLAAVGWWVYRVRTSGRVQHAIVAQYEPYDDALPMYTGMLYNQRLDARDITAGIMYLAEQGMITLTRTERTVAWLFTTTDYELTLTRPRSEASTHFHTTLLELLFPDQAEVPHTVALSTLAGSKKRNRKTVQKLSKSLQSDLRENGFVKHGLPTVSRRAKLIGIVAAVGFASIAFLPEGGPVALFALAGTVVLVAWAAAERRTRKGHEALHHLQGFKRYLQVTGEERFSFHNAPERNPQTFMQYLPYAIALGVDKEWAEVFSDLTIPEPEWYHSTTGGQFSALSLSNDLGQFTGAVASATTSGSSGSSGGGSVGGGSGGGGGGSW